MPVLGIRWLPLACVASLSGCFLFQPGPQGLGSTAGSGEGVIVIEGVVRVGGEGAAGAVSPLTVADAVGNRQPLAGNSGGALIGNAGGALIGNSGAGLGTVSELSSQEPLTADSQLVGNAGAALVGNAGAGLAGNSGGALIGFGGAPLAERRTAAVGSDGHVLFIEVVDGETAGLLFRTRADERGRYSINLGPARARRGLVVQATVVRGSSVTAYLAAPLPIAKGEFGTRTVDATPATTLNLFSQALLAGVRGELEVGKGFRGFRAEGLGKLLPYGDPESGVKAAAALDKTDAFAKATTFDTLLGSAAEHSAVLAKAAADQGIRAGASIASLVAASNLILAEIAAKPPSAAESLGTFIRTAASRVTADAVRKAAGELQAKAGEGTGDILSATIATPGPSEPTPGPSEPTPLPGEPTPAPSPSPTAAPQSGGLTISTLASNFGTLRGAALDEAGNIYVAKGQALRKITPQGIDTAVPVNTTDGTATVFEPFGLVFDLQGNLILAEGGRNRIHKLSPSGRLSVLAGSAQSAAGFVDGASASARFKTPYGLALDGAGNVLVADSGNNAIRKVAPDGTVSTMRTSAEGSLVELSSPYGVAVGADGTVYVANYSGHRIVAIRNESASVFAGRGQYGFKDGPKNTAEFYYPFGVAVAGDGHVLVADSQNRRIRHVDAAGNVTTHAGSGLEGQADGPALEATFMGPAAVNFAPDGRIVVLDGGRIRIIK